MINVFQTANKKRRRRSPVALAGCELLEERRLLTVDVRISEFVANNDESLFDGDGLPSDWIELHNAGSESVDLAGWHLTDRRDDLTQWTFPSFVLGPDAYRVVFASGRPEDDYQDATGNLHTNFALNDDGEFLALVAADGTTIVSEFDGPLADYPQQYEDVSYGIGRAVNESSLVPAGATAQILIPPDDSLGLTWTQPGFVPDANWFEGPTGIGFPNVLSASPVSYWTFDDGATVSDQIGTSDALAIAGGATFSLDVPAGDGFSLDLTHGEDYVLLPDTDYGITNAFTISSWVKRNGTGSGRFFSIVRDLTAAGGDRSGVNLGLSGGNVYAGVIIEPADPANSNVNGGTDTFHDYTTSATSVAPIALNTWTHVAVTLAGDSLTMYVNGVAETVYTIDGSAAGTEATPAGHLKRSDRNVDFVDADGSFSGIGADGRSTGGGADLTTSHFDGWLDDMAVWNVALPADQIAALARRAARPDSAPYADFVETDLTQEMLGPLRNTPVSYWTFDDGATVSDQVGSNDALALAGGASFSADVPAGGGFSLDLTHGEDYVVLPDTTYGITDAYTLSTWVKRNGNGSGHFFSILRDLTGGGGDRSGINVGLSGGNVYAGLIINPADPAANSTNATNDTFHDYTTSATSVATIAPDTWAHVAVTLANDVLTMYVNGVAETVYTLDFGADATEATTAGHIKRSGRDVDFVDPNGSFSGLGADGSSSSASPDLTIAHFDGWLDELAVWNVALAPDEIAALAAGLVKPDSPPQGNSSVYVRLPFEVTDPMALDNLSLKVRYEDGFIAYLNGVEVAARNAPASPSFDSAATSERTPQAAVIPAAIDLSAFLGLLQPGQNVLAVQGLNFQPNDPDFLLLPELIDLEITEFTPRYFFPTTPGTPNGLGVNNSGPAIGMVTHDPPQPTADEDLVVTASIVEQLAGVATVTLTYRAMYGAETSVAMVDDGTGADLLADDGIYTAAIPAAAYAAGEMVRYYITTTDLLDNPAREPAYFRADASAQYFGTVVLDSTLPATELPVFEWFVEDPDWYIDPAGGNTRDVALGSLFFAGQFYDNIQIRVRGGVTEDQLKPNFKFDFYSGEHFTYLAGQSRVEEMNLQSLYGEIPPRTYLRDPLGYELLAAAGLPASQSIYWHVRQNGEFYSLASFTEQVDETFLARQGFDPGGALYKANANALLKPDTINAANYQKDTRLVEDYSDLESLAAGLALVDPTQRERYLFDNLNVPEIVNYLAAVLLGPNHDRLAHNYYLHRDLPIDEGGTAEWSIIPWDVDRMFPVGTLLTSPVASTIYYGDSDHPRINATADTWNALNDAILDVPRTRAMFLTRLRSLMDELLGTQPGLLEERVDAIVAMISPDAALDHAKWGTGDLAAGAATLKNETFPTRRAQLAGEADIPPAVAGIAAIQIGAIDFNPSSGDQDQEYIEIVNPNLFAVDLTGWRLAEAVDFTFQPGSVLPAGESVYVTPNAAAFRQRSASPTGGEGLFVQGSFAGHLSSLGETIRLLAPDGTQVDSLTYEGDPSPAQQFLRITEIGYHPDPPTDDEIAAGHADANDFEFIELQNIGGELLDLTGVHFPPGSAVEFTFTTAAISTLAPGEFVLVVRDEAAFLDRYGAGLADRVAGAYQGRLANGGEQVKLEDASNSTIDEFLYRPDGAWPRRADGRGSSLEVIDVHQDYNDPDNWRPSSEFGGSPGVAGAGPRSDVVVNEVLAHTDLPQFDAIELWNTTDAAIDLSGWYLSDSTEYRKFRIPDAAVIAAGGYLVFDERDFNSTGNVPFAFSAATGDQVYLVQADAADRLVSFADEVDFGASANGEAFGRRPDSTGEFRFVPLQSVTLGAANAAARVGPLIISEIQYNPADPDGLGGIEPNDLEFIEIHNPTDRDVALADWQLQGGIDYEFAADAILAAGAALVVVSFDPAVDTVLVDQFRAQYAIDASVVLVGPYAGVLDNGGETVRLSRPDEPAFAEPDFIPRLVEDQVRYDDLPPWPVSADGGGASLQRTASRLWGLDVASWQAAAPTPGAYADSGATLRVVSMRVAPSGVAVELLRGVDPSRLNLYDAMDAAIDAPDVALIGQANGAIRGSLVWDADRNTLTFLATDGPLPTDDYTLTLHSRSDAWADSAGDLLDGDGDGAFGGDYVAAFHVNSAESLALNGNFLAESGVATVRIANFARGPGQTIDLAPSGGIPVSIHDAAGLTQIGFTLRFDATLLQVTGATRGDGLPDDWQVTGFETIAPGRVRVTIGGTTALDAGAFDLVILEANVPTDAPRGAAQVLRIDQLQLNAGLLAAVAAVADDALHALVYLGDTTNSGGYSALDASLIARVSVGLDTGFDELAMIDPRIVGDATGNGALSALDASFVARKAVGLTQDEIPDLPIPAPGIGRAPSLLPAEQSPDGANYLDFDPSGNLLAAWDLAPISDSSRPERHRLVNRAESAAISRSGIERVDAAFAAWESRRIAEIGRISTPVRHFLEPGQSDGKPGVSPDDIDSDRRENDVPGSDLLDLLAADR